MQKITLANREVVVTFHFLYNPKPRSAFNVLVESWNTMPCSLSIMGLNTPTPQRLPRKVFQPGQLRAILTSLVDLNPHPMEGWWFTILFQLSELKPVTSTKNIPSSYGHSLLELWQWWLFSSFCKLAKRLSLGPYHFFVIRKFPLDWVFVCTSLAYA